MSLLFDQNLSFRLVEKLADLYPEAIHVRDVDLEAATDEAAARGLAITSKDSDFRQRSFLHGAPPKVISICIGNCTTARIESLLRARHAEVQAFLSDPVAALLVLS